MTPSVAFWGGSMSPGEMLVVLAVALILFGAKRLPGIARSLGRAMEELRRAARDVQKEIITADVKETFSEAVTPEQYASEPGLPPGGRPGPEGDGAAWTEPENGAQSAAAAAAAAPPTPSEKADSEPAAAQSDAEPEPPPAG